MTLSVLHWPQRGNKSATKQPVRPKRKTFVPEFERLEVRWLPSWSATGQQSLTDFLRGTLLAYGVADVLPNTGAIRLAHPLDFDKSPGVAVGRYPALVYNSETVNPQPILEAFLTSAPSDGVPSSIQVQLTWNNGTAQPWVTFSTTGHAAGDSYVLAAQVSSPVTTSGAYPWTLAIQINGGLGHNTYLTVSGTAYVVSNTSNDPFGAGWSLAGVDQLVSADLAGDILYLPGAGGNRYFRYTGLSGGHGTFASPPGDFGTLTNGLSGFYTAKDQTRWDFNASGQLTRWLVLLPVMLAA
jgi:hypothetical protein